MPTDENPSFFDFMKEDDPEEIATGGDPGESQEAPEEIATGGNQDPKLLHQGLTYDQIKLAQDQAGSPKGLDMAKYMKYVGVFQIDFDQLFAFKLPKRFLAE